MGNSSLRTDWQRPREQALVDPGWLGYQKIPSFIGMVRISI